MPHYFRSLIFFVAVCISQSAKAQQIVCAMEPVQFQLQEPYYGVKSWEFSTDSLSWGPVDIQENTPLTITPNFEGFYRVRLFDIDCDTSYYSNSVKIVRPRSLQINTAFINGIIPLNINPTFWVTDAEELSNIVYHVNSLDYPAPLNFQTITNPGVDLTVYATATDESGCETSSDTLSFTVVNTNLQTNGIVQPFVDIDLTNIFVRSSVDSTGLEIGNIFDIEYNLDYIYDLVLAARNNGSDPEEVVGLRLALSTDEYLLINEQTTAWSMVFMHPDILFLAADNPDTIRQWLFSQTDFIELESLIQNDLQILGKIIFSTSDKAALVNSLASSIISEGIGRDEDDMYPTLTGSGSVNLLYDHKNINRVYVARAYYDGQPIASPIAFRPEGVTVLAGAIINKMAAMFGPLIPGFDPIMGFRNNNTITVSDFSTPNSINEIDIHLVNGAQNQNSSEEILAARYNENLFYYKMIALLPLPDIEAVDFLESFNFCGLGELIINRYIEMQVLESTELLQIQMNSTWLDITSQLITCAGEAILNFFTLPVAVVQTGGWAVQFFYDGHTREPHVINTVTMVGSKFYGKLRVANNASQTFSGMIGERAKTTPIAPVPDPYIYLQQKAIVKKPNGNVLDSSEYSAGPGGEAFSLFVTTEATQQIKLAGISYPNSSFTAPLNELNIFEWTLANSAVPGEVAGLVVEIQYAESNIPTWIENYQQGSVGFTASVQQPILTIMSGNNQSAASNGALPAPCEVQLTSNGQPVADYNLQVLVTQGGGSVSSNLVTTDSAGKAAVNWTLGNSLDVQHIRIAVNPSGNNQITTADFQAIPYSCNGNTVLGTWLVEMYNTCYPNPDGTPSFYIDGMLTLYEGGQSMFTYNDGSETPGTYYYSEPSCIFSYNNLGWCGLAQAYLPTSPNYQSLYSCGCLSLKHTKL